VAERSNALGQPIGAPVPGWSARARPPREAMVGRYCRVEPLDPACHGAQLQRAFAEDCEGRIWTYLPYGPFATLADWLAWGEPAARSQDPQFHAILDRDGEALGVASFLRIDPANGAIEVGHIHYAPRLQRTTAATEAMVLMMRRVFAELGYRRYEWKCDSLNAPSRRAAERLGFAYEGLFRQAVVYRERNRDTAWYAIIGKEWPALSGVFESWLDPANFDAAGRQRRSLAELTRAALAPLR
jgi:RimJ/RimL family protein N-acetyltransferase